MKARYYYRSFSLESFPRVRECLEQAIALDPKFALAHCEYGLYFMVLALAGAMPADQALPLVRAHAQKALELDPSIPEGHAMLGAVAAFLEFDWKEAERRFHLAMARDPISPLVRWLYATSYLWSMGRPAEALQQLELALQQDPLNPSVLLYRAIILVAAGRDEEASRRFREILELIPAAAPALGLLANMHFLRGELDQARALMEKAYALAPYVPNAIGSMAGLLSRTGDPVPGGGAHPEASARRIRHSPSLGELPLDARRTGCSRRLDRESHRPARPGRFWITAWLVRPGTALHSTLGGLDAKAESAGELVRRGLGRTRRTWKPGSFRLR